MFSSSNLDTSVPCDTCVVDYVLPSGDAISYLVTASPYHDESGTVVGVIESFTDITARRDIEKSYRESEAKYRFIVDQTQQIFYDTDVATGQTKWFGAIEEITGYSLRMFQEIDFDRWLDMMHSDDRELAIKILVGARNRVDKFKIDYRLKRRDGIWRNIHQDGVFLADSYGSSNRMMGSMRDVTERVEAEQQIRMVKYTIDRANDLIAWISSDGRFLYVNDKMIKKLGLFGRGIHY